jgi:hypothetical protein
LGIVPIGSWLPDADDHQFFAGDDIDPLPTGTVEVIGVVTGKRRARFDYSGDAGAIGAFRIVGGASPDVPAKIGIAGLTDWQVFRVVI